MSEQNSAQAHTRFQPEARGPLATIESLDHEGRGVARVEGKTIFIEGALPGEQVTYRTHRAKPNYELADVDQVLRASAQREGDTPPRRKATMDCRKALPRHAHVVRPLSIVPAGGKHALPQTLPPRHCRKSVMTGFRIAAASGTKTGR